MERATNREEDIPAPDHPQRACMACHGSGEVISHLGGEAKTVTCPWCDGTRVRGAIADAQAKWTSSEEASEGS